MNRLAPPLLLLALFSLLAPARAEAQAGEVEASRAPPRAEEGEPPAEAARRHFLGGMGHFQERQFREAIHEFEMAAELVPSADLWFNIARSHEELGEHALAAEYYRRYLRDRVDPPDRSAVERLLEVLDQRAEEARAAELSRPTTGTLRMHTSEDGAGLELDGESIGESPMEFPLSVEPGTHRYDVTSEGYVPFRSEVQVEAGVTTGAFADLDRETEYRAVYRKRRWTWVVGGVGVAALLTSIGLGAYAVSVNNGGDYGRAEDFASYSDYLLATGAVLTIAAVILYFIEGRAIETEEVQGRAMRGGLFTF